MSTITNALVTTINTSSQIVPVDEPGKPGTGGTDVARTQVGGANNAADPHTPPAQTALARLAAGRDCI
ncbi:MAG: hypothetical protein LBD72_03580 [Puniceicoccales bacterium]|nr:hypothetical protein [Puniceicoccales bacterium]